MNLEIVDFMNQELMNQYSVLLKQFLDGIWSTGYKYSIT